MLVRRASHPEIEKCVIGSKSVLYSKLAPLFERFWVSFSIGHFVQFKKAS